MNKRGNYAVGERLGLLKLLKKQEAADFKPLRA